jgi:hypothetical protein
MGAIGLESVYHLHTMQSYISTTQITQIGTSEGFYGGASLHAID